MNIVNILDQIEKVETEVNGGINPRRAAMKSLLSFGKKAVVASVPLGLGSMFSTASAQTSSTDAMIASLQVVLAIKHFELALLNNGLNRTFTKPLSAADRTALTTIKDQESKHIAFLQKTITSAGKVPVAAKATYDFTGSGNYNDINVSSNTFLKIVQGIKDVSVRAIKGQAGVFVKAGPFLEAALAIHAVDARHSAKLRYMRLVNGYSTTNKPWVSERDQTENETIGKLVFIGEDNDKQGASTVTNINGQNVTHAQATEAFDEPLTKDQVASALAPFKVTF
jgi:hypothetical protein